MTHILFPFLLFLLFPPSISSTTTTTTTTNTIVDFLGNPVEPGSRYYIFFSGVGYFFGGLTMVSKPNHPNCPHYVVASPNQSDFGPGIELWPVNPTHKTISTSSDINIAFAGSINCSKKPVWQLTTDQDNEHVYVTTDGVIGDETVRNSWFNLEKVDGPSYISMYKVKYCRPSSNNSSISEGENDDVLCGDLGLSYDGELRKNIWLSLDVKSADPEVYFWPASIKPPLPSNKGGLLWG